RNAGEGSSYGEATARQRRPGFQSGGSTLYLSHDRDLRVPLAGYFRLRFSDTNGSSLLIVSALRLWEMTWHGHCNRRRQHWRSGAWACRHFGVLMPAVATL